MLPDEPPLPQPDTMAATLHRLSREIQKDVQARHITSVGDTSTLAEPLFNTPETERFYIKLQFECLPRSSTYYEITQIQQRIRPNTHSIFYLSAA